MLNVVLKYARSGKYLFKNNLYIFPPILQFLVTYLLLIKMPNISQEMKINLSKIFYQNVCSCICFKNSLWFNIFHSYRFSVFFHLCLESILLCWKLIRVSLQECVRSIEMKRNHSLSLPGKTCPLPEIIMFLYGRNTL